MPRLKNQLPRYGRDKRKSGSDRACVRIGGKKIDLGVWDSAESREKYDQLIGQYGKVAAEELVAAAPTVRPTKDTITVQELIKPFLEHCAKYYGPDTDKRGTTYNLRFTFRPFREQYGTLAARDFGPVRLARMLEIFIEMGHSRTTVVKDLRRIKQLFRWAASQELIDAPIWQAVNAVVPPRKGRSGARETEPVQLVPDDVVDLTLPHLDPTLADMVRLQRLTGARPGEICNLRPGWINRAMDPEVWIYQPVKHKNAHRGQARYIALGPKAQAILLPYLLRPADRPCFSPKEVIRRQLDERHAARTTPMSCGNRPKGAKRTLELARDAYDHNTYRLAIWRACDRAFPAPDEAELKAWRKAHRWSPNQLRHTACQETLEAFDTETAQVKLGHADIRTTQGYAGPDLKRAIAAARQTG